MAIDVRIQYDEAQPLLPRHDEGKCNKSTDKQADHNDPSITTTDTRALCWVVVSLILFHTLYFGLLRMSALPKLVKDLANVNGSAEALEDNSANDDSAKLWGQMASVQSLCGLLAEPMWGIISDTYGRRAALVGNSAGMVISSLLFTAVAWRLTDSESPEQSLQWAIVWVGVVVLGFTSSFLTITSAAVSDVSAPNDVAANFGLWGMALCAGSFIGPLLHTGLSAALPSSAAVFGVVTGGWVVLSVLIAACVPETNADSREALPQPTAAGASAHARAMGPQVRNEFQSMMRVVFLYGPTALLCAVNFMFGVGMEGFYTIYWFYMSHRGFDTVATNTIYSAYSIAQGCVEAILLRILVHLAPEVLLLAAGLASISGAFFGLACAHTLIVAGSSLAFLSIGTGLTYPLLYGLTSRHIKDYQPHNIGAGMAAFRVVCIVAEVTGQLSSSSLFHALSNKGVAWIVAGVSVGLGSIMCGLFAWYELIKRHRSY